MGSTKPRLGDRREDGYYYSGSNGTTERWLCPAAYFRWRMGIASRNARTRARSKGLPFDLTPEYLQSIFPSDNACPVLGIELEWAGDGRDNSPALDRIVPDKGYVKGNVHFISDLANRIKTNATPDQVIRVGEYMKAISADAIR